MPYRKIIVCSLLFFTIIGVFAVLDAYSGDRSKSLAGNSSADEWEGRIRTLQSPSYPYVREILFMPREYVRIVRDEP